MPGFGRGLLLGVGAALLYAAARETIAPARQRPEHDRRSGADATGRALPERSNRLIDWELATRVAINASGRTPSLHPGARAQLQDQYETMLRDIEAPIAQYVGNELSLSNT